MMLQFLKCVLLSPLVLLSTMLTPLLLLPLIPPMLMLQPPQKPLLASLHSKPHYKP